MALKTTVVKPLLKKSNLDLLILNNFMPISNLSFLSKILEKLVYNQLNDYLNSSCIYEKFQSGFRPHHSTETAHVKVLNDLRMNMDDNNLSILVLFDLSAAFDTVDNNIHIDRLQNCVGLSGLVLHWFRTYLYGRHLFFLPLWLLLG